MKGEAFGVVENISTEMTIDGIIKQGLTILFSDPAITDCDGHPPQWISKEGENPFLAQAFIAKLEYDGLGKWTADFVLESPAMKNTDCGDMVKVSWGEVEMKFIMMRPNNTTIYYFMSTHSRLGNDWTEDINESFLFDSKEETVGLATAIRESWPLFNSNLEVWSAIVELDGIIKKQNKVWKMGVK